ncbi:MULTISPECIES: VOC family protein [unclassified Streptomyces]|uniref:VOC family protein n=1 Tax=unclassified Streptomyces TaxID=2593676 RepID=UPI002E2D9553|nr:VOC family protein [Streptomyces sp. NBC_01429]
MILKTYARVFTRSVDDSLPVLRELVGAEPDFRVTFQDLEIAAIGDFCVVAGTDEALAPYRHTIGPLIVDDLDATREAVVALGAELTVPYFESASGHGFYARNPDGAVIEYVRWRPEFARLVFGADH